MPSLNNAADRASLIARLEKLAPDMQPRWGRMSAPKMLAHITDAFRMALGDLPVKPKKIPLVGSFPVKQLVIHVLPFPKNSPTAPEIISREPEAFDVERSNAKALIARLAGNVTYATHPIFGSLTKSEWGALGYKHFDHHLRQFGV
ncbi:MAG: DUF1569 domain-containing protein [Gemmatimonadaceae bacterium]|nr:DUF1569 domain-containing protein [Gemmatimonadaceae bacterium]